MATSRRRHRTRYTGPQGKSLFVEIKGDSISDILHAMAEGVREGLRPAAQAGAQVIYDQVRMNVAGIGINTGNLYNSIYQKHINEISEINNSAYYRISWNHRKAPHGRLLEHGWMQRYPAYFKDGRWYTNTKAPFDVPIQRPGYGFMSSAVSVIPRAREAMLASLMRRVDDARK